VGPHPAHAYVLNTLVAENQIPLSEAMKLAFR
jgi:hypothetical protein